MLDRPLAIGFFWGILTGDYTLSLGVSLFFELLWLDIFPAGTSIPPHALAPALVSLSAVHFLGVSQPAVAAVAMMAALPLGRVFSSIEGYHRQHENDAYTKFLQWAKKPQGASSPFSLIRRSILIMFPLNFIAFCLALSAMLVLLHLLLPSLNPFLERIPLSWPHLWVIASMGAVLSLRHRPAYTLLLTGVALAVASRMFM